MKNHIVLTAALMLCLFHLQAQQKIEADASLREKHSQKFTDAMNISWHRTKAVTYAQFLYQQRLWLAYYDKSGQLVATARKISTPAQLPVLVSRSLEDFRQRQPAGMALGPVYELIQGNATRYVVYLQGDDENYTLMINSQGNSNVIDKQPRTDSPMKSDRKDFIARKIRN